MRDVASRNLFEHQKYKVERAPAVAEDYNPFVDLFEADAPEDTVEQLRSDLDELKKRVRSSQILVADISARNDMVAREIGWAKDAEIKCIQIVRDDCKEQISPASQGEVYYPFTHEIYLALRLYHGLKHLPVRR